MEGMEKILEAILQEGRQAAEEKVAQAERQAADIRNQARLLAKSEEDEALAKAREQAAAMGKIARSAGEQAVRQAMLQAKLDVMEEALALTREKLLDTRDYDGLFLRLLGRYGKNQDGILKMSAVDAGHLSREFPKRLKKEWEYSLTIQVDETMPEGGFVLVYGDMEENCLFDALIAGRREELLDAVYPFLFPSA